MKAINLRTEYLVNPVGIEIQHPRLMWICGRIESGWEKKGGHTVFTVTVPANCAATVRLPDGSEQVQEPGTKVYNIL